MTVYNIAMNAKLSVLMITKNAAETLEKSLASIKKIADEIIVVDGGSSDDTVLIAKKHHSKIFNYKGRLWEDQCQIGLEKAVNDWLLVLDSDEVVPQKLSKEILSVIHDIKMNCTGYYIKFQTHYLEKPLCYGGENYKKMVLFKKKFGLVKQTLGHYFYEVKKGKTGQLKNKILHYSYRSVSQMFVKFTSYGIRMGKEKYLGGEKSSFKKIFLYPIHMFWARFITDKGYEDGLFRIPLDLGFAYMEFVTYVSLSFFNLKNKK